MGCLAESGAQASQPGELWGGRCRQGTTVGWSLRAAGCRCHTMGPYTIIELNELQLHQQQRSVSDNAELLGS